MFTNFAFWYKFHTLHQFMRLEAEYGYLAQSQRDDVVSMLCMGCEL